MHHGRRGDLATMAAGGGAPPPAHRLGALPHFQRSAVVTIRPR
jgi:hypothetical protein